MAVILMHSEQALAQAIQADNTLGTNVQSLSPVDFKITGGKTSGPNLFHSFQQFSIPTTGRATLDLSGNPDITTIFSRVTGPTISNLDGILRVTNHNNRVSVFLMNPNGIIFGPNAQLNIFGSFLATTASSIQFSDGLRFDSTADAAVPLLSIRLPIGLQFGSNAGPIVNQAQLAVAPGLGTSLGLIGNGIKVDGGQLISYEGHVEVGSVGAGSWVGLNQGKANYAGVTDFQDVKLTNAAVLDTSGTGPGSMQLQGRQILIEGYSRVFAQTWGAGVRDAAMILRASESIVIKDADGDRSLQTFVGTEIAPSSLGNAPNIIVETPILDIQGGAQIRANNFGQGQGSNIAIRVGQLRAIGESADTSYTSGIANRSERGATGAAGTTTIEAQTVLLQDGAQIRTSTFGGGRGGDLFLTAQNLTLSGRSQDPDTITGITASSKSRSTARGGDIHVVVDQLKILDSSGIRTATEGKGDSGDIYITANDIFMASPPTSPYRSWGDISYIGASTQSSRSGAGKGGNITIVTQGFTMQDGASVLSESYGPGMGGQIKVNADRINASGLYISGDPSRDKSFTFHSAGFSTAAYGSGPGGDIRLNTKQIQFSQGAEALSATFGSGNAGNIFVTSDQINLTGQWTDPRVTKKYLNLKSGFIGGSDGSGNAGTIEISTRDLNLSDNAVLSIGSYKRGNSGNLKVTADRLKLDTGSMINSDLFFGTQGNISLNAKIIELRNSSSITTNADFNANGGNIQINSDFLIGLENSDIAANAFQGRGGTIDITALSVLGLQYRDRLTPDNDITASSQVGLNGTVNLNSLNLDPTRGINSLATEFVDSSMQISNTCKPQAQRSKLIITGRGGVAENPIDHIVRMNPWGDIRPVIPTEKSNDLTTANHHPNPVVETPLVEANTLKITRSAEGLPEIELTGPQPKALSDIAATCGAETRSPKI
jgi:filamentous hemagglutinin family protein